ncbi:MAG: O-antigen ligase family protein [Fusobacterium gastrosuis]|uniref:O-antigen ligase family protein n=1 Tax=Fusobacterium gastrosuis TaxID=1755100 RepID=UPI002A8D7B2C|nr:O-antigen ligase family protein [Fusobacterium gastrosuis]
MFFLSRRGGDTKDKFSLALMIAVLMYSFSRKYFSKYKEYKLEIFVSSIYLFFVSNSYFYTSNKSEDLFYTFLHASLYSIVFFLVVLNFKLEEKYISYILPLLLLITISPMIYGIRDFIENYNILDGYRLHGDSYTTKYALDLGIYFLIGFFSFIYYKNKYLKVLLLLYLTIDIILIVGTQSRNDFIMLPLTLILITLFKNYKKGIIVIAVSFILGILIIKSPLEIKGVERIKNSLSTMDKIKKDARYILFKEGIEISKKNLFKGDGFFRYKGDEKRINEIEYYEHFHNIFIETAVTQGVLALISYVIFLLTLFYRLVKNYFVENNELKKNIKLMTIAIFIFSHLYGLAEPIFYFEKLYQLIFTIIAISIIIDDPDLEKERKEKK